MSVLIKGIKMPKKGTCIEIVIFGDGTVEYYDDDKKIGEAVELPNHGNLIDRSALLNREVHSSNDYQFTVSDLLNAPVIIPHDGGEW